MDNFINRLNVLLKEKQISQKDLCAVVGIYPTAISNWKKRNATPSGDVLCKIARYLDTSVEYLITGNEPHADDYKQKYADLVQAIKDFASKL